MRPIPLLCLFTAMLAGEAAAGDKTIITLPEKAGRFSLAAEQFNPAVPRAGVLALYTYPGQPKNTEIRVEAHIFGRRADDLEAVEESARNFEAGMRRVQQFQQMQVASSPMWVDARRSFLDTGKKPAAAEQTDGLRQIFGYKFGELDTYTVAMEFYRNMHIIRVTLTASLADVSSKREFGNLATEAAQQLVPNIDIRNFGSCADGGPDPAQPDKAKAILDEAARLRRENCAASEAAQPTPLPEGKRYELEFDAGMMKR